MVSEVETLLTQSNRMFDDVLPLRSFQQELAENFYPELSDFTQSNYLGKDFAANLTTSFPMSVSRDLANIFSTMLRPQDKIWSRMSVRNYHELSEESKRWLEWGSVLHRNAMYDQDSGFTRATAQSDRDIATFGQTVISCEMNWRKRALLIRNWHLRDVVWGENADGTVGRVDRKWFACITDLNLIFKGNISPKLKERLSKEPYAKVEVRHMFIPVEQYDNGKGWHKNKNYKFVSIFYDIENRFILEEVPYRHEYYVVPRWQTLPGSQYAYSPASIASLPDARLLQDMMLVMLEAGQKAVDPPMLAYEDVLRSDANLYAGGVTTVDAEYDERLGRPLSPVFDSRTSNIGVGADLIEMIKMAMRDSHFLNKVSLPPLGSGMSQMEVSQRVGEYIRSARPLFEPLTQEYNGQLCTLVSNVLFHNGGFGDPRSIPEELLGRRIDFVFENSLTESADKVKGNMLLESAAVINNMAAFDPSVMGILDAHEAVRDTIDGIGAPRKWFRTREEVDAQQEQAAAQEEAMGMMTALNAGAQTAEQLGKAGQALQEIQ